MLTRERQDLIVAKLRAEGRLLSSELSRHLAVSEDTVRRDLRQLAEAGLLVKVHGGAVPRSTTKLEFNQRKEEFIPQKRGLAREAVRLVRPGSVVFFDAGTTVLELVRALPRDLAFTAVTHSPLAVAALSELPEVEVVLIGGRILKSSVVAVGAETVAAYSRVRADLAFIGVCCVDQEAGITDPSYEEAAVKNAMIANASALAVLATTDKLGKVSSFSVAPASAVDHLVTDDAAPETMLAAWRALGVDVCVAKP